MNKMYLKMTAIMMASVFLFSSCASIVSKSTYPLSINSSPSNAKVSITDKKGKEIYLGNTPANVKLKAGAGFFSRAEYQVKFSSPGYDDKIVPITFKLDGWYFGNILFGGLLGMLIIDPATGAMWKIETEFLNETLSKSTSSIDPEMKIMNINEIPEN
ncbi:MAG TPA: PEGA domain-containing protein [Bacteroidales bacterium]|nr:PEGA domain-containing protein [Bacteroidales bacterium]